MKRGNIAAVSYLNTIPFVFGINRVSPWQHEDLLLDIPSNCAANFISNKAQIALIPAADLRKVDSYKIITDYCLGSNNKVRSVVVVSHYPIDSINTIYLDSHSHTSVELTKILSKERWMIDPEYKSLDSYNTIADSDEKCAYLLIGDKVFDYESKFKYSYDLAQEWYEMTSLPFVFAVWIAKEYVEDKTVEELNKALKYGVDNIEDAVDWAGYSLDRATSIEYLQKNISFEFDDDKKIALNRFLQKIPPSPPAY